MYHNIDIESGFNTVSKSNFKNQIKFLIQKEYDIVPISIYIEYLRNNRRSKKHIVITFDDAYDSFKSIALPILEEFEIPATLFIPTGFVGKNNQWDSHLTDQNLNILSWEGLRILSSNKLVTIGSHGHSHRPLSILTKDEIDFEINESKRLIEETLGARVRYFSYPYGQYKHFNKMSIEILKNAGYEAACSTNWGKFNSIDLLFTLNRIEIEPGDSIENFSKKIETNFHIKYFKQLVKNMLSILK